ncbi:MAG: sugar phosphate isomerase/epimerase [Clostridia bacterium]|nr:sugar phosphate isomerase/epimerase [Clostridia bacterium]
MNVGICIRLQDGLWQEQLRHATANGIHHCQLVGWLPEYWNDEMAETIKREFAAANMEITAFWCGWVGPKKWNFTEGPETLGIVPVTYRHVRIQNLLSGAAFARKLGLKDVITHMGFIPENASDPNYPGVRAAVRYLAEELKKNDQNLLFETGQETPVTLLRLIEEVGTGNLFINLDPANLIVYGKANPIDAMDVFGAYVRGVHAKDGTYPTNGNDLGPEVKVGCGKVNFPAFIKALKEHGYDGSITIEREIKGEQQLIDIVDTKHYLENIFATLK